MSAADEIKRARLGRGWSASRLGREAGLDVSTVTRFEKGERVGRSDSVDRMRVALGLDQPPPPRRTIDDLLREALGEIERQPVIWAPETTNPAAAGDGAPADVEYWPYRPAPAERDHRFIAVPVKGTCMEPKVMQGHRALVDLDASPMVGNVVVALVNGETIIRQLQVKKGRQYLVALNGHEPIPVTEDVRIIGVAKTYGYR